MQLFSSCMRSMWYTVALSQNSSPTSDFLRHILTRKARLTFGSNKDAAKCSIELLAASYDSVSNWKVKGKIVIQTG